MATTLDDRMQVDERYSRATSTADLGMSLERRTDADVLLAAGWSGQRHRTGGLALVAYRMKATGDLAQREDVVSWLIDRIARRAAHKKLPYIRRDQARVVVETVINWWLNDNCEACTGRLMEPVPGTPFLSDNWCKACEGTGKRGLPNLGPRFNVHRDWIASELESMLSFIMGEMARILSPAMELKTEVEPP